jgi:chromosome segregation ATPase
MAVSSIATSPITPPLGGAEASSTLRTAAAPLFTEAATELSRVAIAADSHQADTLCQHLLTGELRAAECALSTTRCSLEGSKSQINAVIDCLHAATTLNDKLRADLDLKEKENLQLRDLSKRSAAELERAVPAERQLRAQVEHTESHLATTRATLLHAQSSLSQALTELDHVRGASDGLHVQLSQTQTELALVGQARDGVREELSQLTLQLRQAQDALGAVVQREASLLTAHDEAIQASPH